MSLRLPKMTPWKTLSLFNVLLVPIVTAIVVSAEPRFIMKLPVQPSSKKVATCLPLGMPCLKSKLPCCKLTYQNNYLKSKGVPTTCFKFGKGICQVNQFIENFDEYIKLIEQVNGTNFQELKSKYWLSIPSVYTCPQKITLEMKRG